MASISMTCVPLNPPAVSTEPAMTSVARTIGTTEAHPLASGQDHPTVDLGATQTAVGFIVGRSMRSMDEPPFAAATGSSSASTPLPPQNSASITVAGAGVPSKPDSAAGHAEKAGGTLANAGSIGTTLGSLVRPTPDRYTPKPGATHGMMPTLPTLPTLPKPVAEQRPTSQREQAIGASDTLGSYFRGSNKNDVALDDIKKLSADTTGTVPPEVKKAAQFMLDHPGVWKKIETHDVKNADNVAAVSNFAAYSKESKDVLAASAKSSDALAGYFRGINKDSVSLDDIKKLAAGDSKTVPEDVKKAAQFMVDHKGLWKHIETTDVKGRDDISSVANFEAHSKAIRASLAAPVDLSKPAASGSAPAQVSISMLNVDEAVRQSQESVRGAAQSLYGAAGTAGSSIANT